jgi:hypothetical protein
MMVPPGCFRYSSLEGRGRGGLVVCMGGKRGGGGGGGGEMYVVSGRGCEEVQ